MILKYCDVVSLDPSVAGWAQHRFRLHTIYDPDLETGGHQPFGYDQYFGASTIYDRYRVVRAKWSASFELTGGTGTSVPAWDMLCGSTVTKNGVLAAPSTIYETMERPSTIYRRTTPIITVGHRGTVIRGSVVPARFRGKSVKDSDHLYNTNDDSAEDAAYVHFWTQTKSGVDAVDEVKITLQLTYYVQPTSRVIPGPS